MRVGFPQRPNVGTTVESAELAADVVARKTYHAVCDISSVNAATPTYIPVQGYWNAIIAGGNAPKVRTPATKAGTAKNARLVVNVAVAATTTVTATLQVNEVDTAIAMTYADTDAADTAKTDASDVAIVAGDRLRWKLEHNNGAARAVHCGLSFDIEEDI